MWAFISKVIKGDAAPLTSDALLLPIYYILPNKRVNRITVLPRAIFKKLNCPRLNNCLSYDTFNFLKRGVIKLSSWTINKYEM